MEIKVAFESDAFSVTQDFWKKAVEYLGIKNIDRSTHVKRMASNQIQIF